MEAAQPLPELERLLESLRSNPAAHIVSLTDAVAGAEYGRKLRRCAIPHQFDARVLVPLLGVDVDSAERLCERFAKLSIVQVKEASYAIHDIWRRTIFQWWLKEENRLEFARASISLAAYFEQASQTLDGVAAETAALRGMYHLLGGDRRRGMAAFESLCRRARHQWRFAECSALIRSVHEYDDILQPAERATLAYHEGKLAADLHDWGGARRMFRVVAECEEATLPLRVYGLVRLGNALRNAGSAAEAVETLDRALSVVSSIAELGIVRWRVLQELGEAYRDCGDLQRAEQNLEGALEAARADENHADVAGVLSSLGTVYLRRREAAAAVRVLKESLDELTNRKDLMRPAQVLNNLGLAYCELNDWDQAEAAFRQSLERKRQASDVYGQAVALQNLGHVLAGRGDLEGALRAATEAALLFESRHEHVQAAVVRESIAKYQSRRGDAEGARASLDQALSEYQASNDAGGMARIREEVAEITKRQGLPWWAWVFVLVPVVILLLVIAAWIWSR